MSKYVLYELEGVQSRIMSDFDLASINNKINSSISKLIDTQDSNLLAIVYPTHDSKLYISYKNKEIENSNKNLPDVLEIDDINKFKKIDQNKNIALDKVTNLSDQLLDLYRNKIGEPIIKTGNGVDYIELDSYQYQLLEFLQSQKDSLNLSLIMNRSSLYEASGYNSTKQLPGLTYFYKEKNFKIDIHKGDLLDQKVDIIVNAANSLLWLGGGVAGAILKRCGNRIQQDCDSYMKKRGGHKMDISEVMHTSSNNKINAKYIIHACGPRWDDYYDKTKCYEDLKDTFYNTLMYTENKLNAARSIAIPLISSGIFSVPMNICCKALYNSIEDYLLNSNDQKRNLELVCLVNIDDKTNNSLVDFFKEKLSRSIDFDINQIKQEISMERNTVNFECKPKIEVDFTKKDTENIKKELKNKIKDDNLEENFNILKKECSLCKDPFDLRYIKENDCGCLYCSDCYENIEQGNECLCKSGL
ncbi:unnamed protein product [Brachionus calyciflorus]|uniref:Macro domain-containing protein n=1 Tax=Brachionus calyciflorus TaxID=104777 RepID=A0A813XJ99_9BILA|nr:unnamed protein product [Brachionus calyciflorus]